jgi:hypothetical protein
MKFCSHGPPASRSSRRPSESRSRDLVRLVSLLRTFLQPPGRLTHRLFEKAQKSIEFYRILQNSTLLAGNQDGVLQ